jgi:hypothetical protein
MVETKSEEFSESCNDFQFKAQPLHSPTNQLLSIHTNHKLITVRMLYPS